MARALALTLLVGGLLLNAVPAMADGDPSPDDDVEEVEDVEPVEVVQPTAVGGDTAATAGPGLVEYVGRLHPLLVHLPIGWLLALVLFDLAGLVFGREGFARAGFWLLVLTVAAAIPAVITGLLRADELADKGAQSPLFADHRNLMLTVTGLCIVALGVRIARRKVLDGAWRWIYLIILLSAAGLMAWGGHLGGQLVYGQDYLPL
jgi:uncharacterized membrane protein